MAELGFDKSGCIRFPTKYHGDVTLSKKKWDEICLHAERQWYKFNGEKVATTLVTPDRVRYHYNHQQYTDQFFYYKEFISYNLTPNITIPVSIKVKFFAVIIDTNTNKVCTVYAVRNPKKGRDFQP